MESNLQTIYNDYYYILAKLKKSIFKTSKFDSYYHTNSAKDHKVDKIFLEVNASITFIITKA